MLVLRGVLTYQGHTVTESIVFLRVVWTGYSAVTVNYFSGAG